MSLAGNLTVSAMSIISVSLLFRALSVSETGLWVLFMTAVGLADSIRAGFLTTAFIPARSGATPERTAEVTGSAWAIALVITAGMGLLNLSGWAVFSSTSDVSTALLLRWFGVVVVVTLPYFMATCVMQSEMRFDRILYIRLLSQGLFVLIIIGLMVTDTATLNRVVYAYVGASALTSLLTLVFGWADFGTLGRRSSACIRELGHFGKYSVGSYVGSNLLRSSDTFIINYMLGPAPLAVYNLAGRFMEIIEIPLRSFMATAISPMSAAFNQDRLPEVARLVRKNAGMLTWAFVPVILGTILLADIPVYLIGGAKYQGTEAANLLRLGMAMSILYPIDRFVGIGLDVVNQPQLNLAKVFLMLGFNVVGDITAVHLFDSIYGVAAATLPTFLAGFVFGYLKLKKFLPISLKEIMVTGFLEIKALIFNFLGKPVALNSNSNS